MKVIIVGGTGFIGYHSALELLRRGHSVKAVAIEDVLPGTWFPGEARLVYKDVFEASRKELKELFTGWEALVYAVGPDDRFIPKAPAYDFFHEKLVVSCKKVLESARDAGVKRCAVCNSYLAYFDRTWPEKKLAERHPYIRCRVEQASACLSAGGDSMAVMILELPYIFGAMPGRIPLWKHVLFERLKTMKPFVMFPGGGTQMIAVEHAAEAVAGALESGEQGRRYAVGDENMPWKRMLRIILDAMDLPRRKVVTIPTCAASLYGKRLRKKHAREGREAGLNYARLFEDILSRYCYFDAEPAAKALRISHGGIEDSIIKTVKACYPPGD